MGDIILYTARDGAARVEVIYQDETFWLTQIASIRLASPLCTTQYT